MNRIKELLNYLPLKTGPFGYFIAFLQFFYLYQLVATADVGGISFSAGSIGLIILSLFSVYWFFQVIAALCSATRLRLIIGVCIGFSLYDILIAYQFKSQNLLNWSVIASNFQEAFSVEAWEVMFNNLDGEALVYIPIVLGLYLVLEYFRHTLSKSRQRAPLLKKSLAGLAVYLILILNPFDSYDPLVNFFRSILHHYQNPINLEIQYPSSSPHTKSSATFDSIQLPKQAKRPHIFLIVCESLNENRIHRYTEDGKAITPFLNQLSENSVRPLLFYGNSVQTAKGYFSILFSSIPTLTGKTFVNNKELRVKSLADALNTRGYHSLLFSGHDNPNFDNYKPFMTARGLDFVLSKPYVPKDAIWRSWGPEDSGFFDAFFNYYDQELKGDDSPLFVILKTASHHFPFHPSRQLIYPDADGINEDFDNSTYLTDLGVQRFFERLKAYPEFKNSMIIVTSDHAFPLGEHGDYNLESGYHEESFRIPFFLTWEGVLKPGIIHRPSSQLDIAPTILDLLDINDFDSQFIGDSIFSDSQNPIYLIQPYVKHLSVVRYPLKYRFNTRLQKEYLYNLVDDPMEERNILSTLSTEDYQVFKRDLEAIYISDYLIQKNLFWPEDK